MELANPIYPMRAAIRCKAKQQLLCDPETSDLMISLNEALFQEIATTLFQSEPCQAVYQPCASRQEATNIEDWVATELAITYKRIAQKQQDPLVQRLNALL